MTRRNPEKKVNINMTDDVVIPSAVVEEKANEKKATVTTKKPSNSLITKKIKVNTVEDLRQKLINKACDLIDKSQFSSSYEPIELALNIYTAIDYSNLRYLEQQIKQEEE